MGEVVCDMGQKRVTRYSLGRKQQSQARSGELEMCKIPGSRAVGASLGKRPRNKGRSFPSAHLAGSPPPP